ncbi:MAG: DUF3868 domain-containing protein [Rikenellaceae bacterium]|jgi:outer membrane protein OmpA-like peptidoglycan-associated protein|nr:DUF3868 domain-containing protein [Rikenellaceae bacterium]
MKKPLNSHKDMWTKYMLPFAAATLCAMSARAAKAPMPDVVAVRLDSVFTRGDSLYVGLHVETHNMKLGGLQALSLVPVIRAREGNRKQYLPPVIYTGRKRARMERRAEAVAPSGERTVPYATYIFSRKKTTLATEYRVRTLYEAWMGGGAVEVELRWHDCCSENTFGGQRSDAAAIPLPPASKQGAPEGAALASNPAANGATQPGTTFPPAVASQGNMPTAPAEQQSGGRPEQFPATTASTAQWVPDPARVRSMVLFLAPTVETVKLRSESVSAHIDFKLNSWQILPSLGRNATELTAVDGLVRRVAGDELIRLNAIHITGYASPEGSWDSNDKLARNRSMSFKSYMIERYPSLPKNIFQVNSVAEDWDGLARMLEASDREYRRQALEIIGGVGIFGGREKRLMLLQGGAPYRDMLENMFPPLRRIEVRAEFTVLPAPERRLRELLFTRPDLLSLEEMFRAAADIPLGTYEYRRAYEIAASRYPDSVIANNNAAAAALTDGDTASARRYVERTGYDPLAFVNRGALAYAEGDMEAAAAWFRRAAEAGVVQGGRNLEYIELERGR